MVSWSSCRCNTVARWRHPAALFAGVDWGRGPRDAGGHDAEAVNGTHSMRKILCACCVFLCLLILSTHIHTPHEQVRRERDEAVEQTRSALESAAKVVDSACDVMATNVRLNQHTSLLESFLEQHPLGAAAPVRPADEDGHDGVSQQNAGALRLGLAHLQHDLEFKQANLRMCVVFNVLLYNWLSLCMYSLSSMAAQRVLNGAPLAFVCYSDSATIPVFVEHVCGHLLKVTHGHVFVHCVTVSMRLS